MERKKPKFKYWHVIFLLLVVAIGFFFYNFQNKNKVQDVSQTLVKNKTIYPTLYSDKHITSNAIATDSRYKDLTFSNKESYLANIFSFFTEKKPEVYSEKEDGTWLWTPIERITPEYRDSIIAGAKNRGIKNIYLSIDPYLDIFVMQDGKEKDEKKDKFVTTLVDFIKNANLNGITVDAEAGWRNWAEPGNEYKALAVLSFAVEYNKTHKEKFRGFQYDIEPYMLENYDENKNVYLYNFVSLVDKSVEALKNSDLVISVVVPEFYDKSGETASKFRYGGKSKYAIEHLLSVLDKREGSKIIVMAYRNFTEGVDGTVDISKDEINSANKSNTKIIIAQEFSDVLPKYITYYKTSYRYYGKQLALINTAFEGERSFGGTATHYVNAYLDLK